jgi:PAS domain S-box-containing protein
MRRPQSPAQVASPIAARSAAISASQTSARRNAVGLILAVVLMNLLVASISCFLLWNNWQTELKTAEIETSNLARLVEQNLSSTLDKAGNALGSVVSQLERQIAGAGIDKRILWDLVDAEVALVPEIQRIGVFDINGQQVCGALVQRCQKLNVVDRDYFQHLRDGPDAGTALFGPYRSKIDDQFSIVLARAIRRSDGGFVGVAIALIPLQRLQPILASVDLGARGAMSLRAGDLTLLLRWPPPVRFDDDAPQRSLFNEMSSFVKAHPTVGRYRAVSAIDGVDRQTAYRLLAKYPLYVLVGMASADYLVAWRQTLAWTIAFLLLFGLASVVIVGLIRHGIKRQEKVQALYDNAPCGYHLLDAQGLYLSVNATELIWLGCGREAVVGRMRLTDFLDGASKSNFERHFQRLQQTGASDGIEIDLISRDGTLRHVLINSKAVKNREGQLELSNSVMHDISELHQTRLQLQGLAHEQGLMLDTDLIGIVKLVDDSVVWKNHGLDRIFGCAADDSEDLHWQSFFPDALAHTNFRDQVTAATSSGGLYRNQVLMLRQNGTLVWIDASGMILSSARGELMLLLADITAMKHAETVRVKTMALEAQNAQLRDAGRLMGEFLANLAHELRTPLNAVLGFAQLLHSGLVKPDSPDYADNVDQIRLSGEHLLESIDVMLDFARVEAGTLAFHAEPVDLTSTIHDLIEMLQLKIAARHLQVEIGVDPEIGLVVIDPLRLRQVLLHFVGNAIKFSHDAGRIWIRALGDGQANFRIEVEDQGIGVAAADLPRLFSQFVQLSTGDSKTHPGTGLGLALARRLVEAQGGTVGVRSEPQVGSVFHLSLPRQPLAISVGNQFHSSTAASPPRQF